MKKFSAINQEEEEVCACLENAGLGGKFDEKRASGEYRVQSLVKKFPRESEFGEFSM